jgi:hypothetical protein
LSFYLFYGANESIGLAPVFVFAYFALQPIKSISARILEGQTDTHECLFRFDSDAVLIDVAAPELNRRSQ